jgi:microcystin-dependent protein
MKHHQLSNTSVPVGSVVAFAGEISQSKQGESYKTPLEPLGWLVCDGRLLNTHLYPELFLVLGYLYGGDAHKFAIPDLRGMFLRGIGTDQASSESRKSAPGGVSNGIGSTQDFALQKHVHIYTSPIKGTVPPGTNTPVPVDNSTNPRDMTEPPTENLFAGNVKVSDFETRPVNAFIYYIIKYTYGQSMFHRF